MKTCIPTIVICGMVNGLQSQAQPDQVVAMKAIVRYEGITESWEP